MKQLTTKLFAAALTLTPATLLAEPPAAATKEKVEVKKEEKKADKEVVIEANDQMQFNNKALEVKAGETVKLTLKHVGKLPKMAMGHNIVVLKKGTNLAAWAGKAAGAAANGYIPTDKAEQEAILAQTKLIGGGESDSVTFSIKEAGEYQFLCSFPGHFAIMQGKITVK